MQDPVILAFSLTLAVAPVIGCSARVTDHVQQPSEAKPTQPTAQTETEPSSTEVDLYLVKLSALRQMFDNFAPHPGEDSPRARSGYECFIVEDDSDARRLAESFSTFRFPVYGPDRIAYRNGTAVDKATETKAMVWKVEVNAIEATRTTARVHWYQGPRASAAYTLTLTKVDNEWRVDSIELLWIS
jgi:hypothetical protein